MLKVIKIGGNVIDDPQKLDTFLTGFSQLKGPKILVHGGGKIASSLSKDMGLEPRMVEGRRVTDEPTLRIVTMVYAGLINKTIVNKLNFFGCKSVGLCGADGELLISKKRPPVQALQGPVDYGFVGDPSHADTKLLEVLLREGFSPVVAPITSDGNGLLLNTNADTVAASLAAALSEEFEVELVYCFEKPGVMLDINDEASLIREIDKNYYSQLLEAGVVYDGMLPKLDNAFLSVDSGVTRVVICSSDNILAQGYGGTTIIR